MPKLFEMHKTYSKFNSQVLFWLLDMLTDKILIVSVVAMEPTCRISDLPALPFATNDAMGGDTVPVGTNVSFTCDFDYRLAPEPYSTVFQTATSVTCLYDGTFSPLLYHSCVCRYYFNRLKSLLFSVLVTSQKF